MNDLNDAVKQRSVFLSLVKPMEDGTLLTPVKAARKEKILDAAERLFAQDGYRATTMEGIATAVQMSKATVYSYFKDKDALFVAVAERFMNRLVCAVKDSIDPNEPLRNAIAVGLVAKYTICYKVLRSSPYSRELFAASNEMVVDLQKQMNAGVEQTLFEAMHMAGRDQTEARNKARLLTGAVEGIANNAADFDIAMSDIRALVNAVV